jgi:enamine deaminase RidA (YjgF/YER057c/UK114 family)
MSEASGPSGRERGTINAAVMAPTIAPPAANYVHAMVSPAGSRLLHTSGVVPIAADGTVPEAVADQAVLVWANLAAIVAEAGMAMTDVVSVTTYVVAGQPLAEVMAARDAALAGHRAASTLLVVPELARPEWKLEIALVAAGPA